MSFPAAGDPLASGSPGPLPGLSLRRNFTWTLAGNVVYAACQWGMVVAIAKLGTPAMLGRFSLGFVMAAPAYVLTNLHLRAVLATDTRREFAFGHYLALRIIGTALALVLILVAVLAAGYSPDTAAVVVGVALAKAAEAISDILYGLWQSRERLDKIARAMSGRGLASLLALAAVLLVTKNIGWAVAALAVVWWAWLLSYEGAVARAMLADAGSALGPRWEMVRLKALARLSLPLGLVMLLLSLNASIPRLLVERSHGEAALGYLAAMAYLVVAGTTVVGALGQSASPRFARFYVSDRGAFQALLARMVGLALALGIGGVVLAALGGRWILAVLYRPDYGQYADVLSILAVAGSLDLVSGTLGFAFTATRRFSDYVVPLACNTGAGAAFGLLIVPAMGLRGAAFTVLFLSAGQLLALGLLLRRALAVGADPAGTAPGE